MERFVESRGRRRCVQQKFCPSESRRPKFLDEIVDAIARRSSWKRSCTVTRFFTKRPNCYQLREPPQRSSSKTGPFVRTEM
jgi:hypothetical protein